MGFGTNLDRKLEQLHKRAIDAVVADIDIIPDLCIGNLIPKCQSPIEKLLVEAMLISFQHRNLCRLGDVLASSHFDDRLPGKGFEPKLDGELNFIDCQVPIDRYTADLVVCRWVSIPIRNKGILKSPLVVIECDGHNFHERTKEQAEHDKSRDRFIQQEGYAVLRFTGSEIWRDAWGCAQQVNDFLTQKIKDAKQAGRYEPILPQKAGERHG